MEQMTNEKKKRPEQMSKAYKITVFIGSVFVALLLWIYAIGYDSTLFEYTFSGVPVVIEGEEYLALTKGYTLAEEQNFSSITVKAKGKSSELNQLDASDFRAVVDVSLAQSAGYQTLNIVVYSPNGVEVVSQSSTTVDVYVDEFTQRNELLSVAVDMGDDYVMGEGVTFVEAVANPLSVTVSGPRSVINSIEGAYVNFNLENKVINDHISGYGAIELRDKNGNTVNNPYLKISESTAYVEISVTKQKTVPVRVALVGGLYSQNDVTVSSSVGAVTVSGKPEALASLDEIVLEIDETAISGTKEFEFSVGALLPDGVSNDSGFSKITVTVTLPELSVRNYYLGVSSITVENLPEGNTFEIKNGFSVTLIGPRDAFNDFDYSAITASVNFDRVTVELDGSYTADAKVTVNGEYSGIYVQNKKYQVNFRVKPMVSEPEIPDISDESSVPDSSDEPQNKEN